MTHDFDFHPERIASDAFLAPNATVLGDVCVGSGSSIWFGAVVRGDTEAIRIGQRSNIQDLSVLHADPGFPCELGDRVTVGHGAIVHGAIVEDDAMIGMRAVVLNGARIGAGSLVGAGSVVPEGMQVPPNSLVLGIPAKVRRETTDEDRQRIARAATHYAAAAQSLRARPTQ